MAAVDLALDQARPVLEPVDGRDRRAAEFHDDTRHGDLSDLSNDCRASARPGACPGGGGPYILGFLPNTQAPPSSREKQELAHMAATSEPSTDAAVAASVDPAEVAR